MLHSLKLVGLFRRRDLRILLPARAFSAFGDDLAVVVLTLRLYSQTHSPWSITGLLLCSAVPVVVLAPVAGRLVDALPFRRLALATGLWQAGCCAALALTGSLWATYALVLVLQVGQVVAGPTWQALLATIAADDLGPAVAGSQALNRLAAVAAPAAAGVLAASLGYGRPLYIDAVTFLCLAAAARAIKTSRGGRTWGGAEPTSRPAFSLRADSLVFPLVIGLCLLVLAGESTNVVEVFLVRGSLGASPAAFGLLGGLLAVALVAGSLAAGRTATDAVRALRALVAAFALAVGLVLGGLAPSLAVFAAAWTVVGAANGMLNTDVSTLLLTRTPEAYRGRVLARVNGLVRGASVAALGLGGVAGSLLGPRTTFVAAGALMAATALALLARFATRRPTPTVEDQHPLQDTNRSDDRVLGAASVTDEPRPSA